jgi:hypothetical protein
MQVSFVNITSVWISIGFCDVHKMSFGFKSVARRSLHRHSREHAYSSDVCNRSFRGKNSFAALEDLLPGKHQHHCNVCKKSFNYKIALNVHRPVQSGGCPWTARCVRNVFHGRTISVSISLCMVRDICNFAVCVTNLLEERAISGSVGMETVQNLHMSIACVTRTNEAVQYS